MLKINHLSFTLQKLDKIPDKNGGHVTTFKL